MSESLFFRVLNEPPSPKGEARLVALADLGYGVLDTPIVETAANVLEKGAAR